MKHIIACSCIFFGLLVPSTALCNGMQRKMQEWFDRANDSNVTHPGMFKTQGARHVTLGGISIRGNITQPTKLLNIQTPRFSAGCGGIDFYAGGLSAVTSEYFVEMLKNVGQSSGALALMLGIQIVSPQLSGIMKDVQTWANKYLTMNLDSCQMATKLVGGSMELFGEQQGECIVNRINHAGEDWTTANHNCSTGGRVRDLEEKDDITNQVSFVNGNLAWHVLMKDSFFRDNTDIAEMVMNLTGTIILNYENGNDDSGKSIRILRPATKDGVKSDRFDNIYKGMLHGSNGSANISIYRCRDPISDSEGCTELSESLQGLTTPAKGIHGRISGMIHSIVEKIGSDQMLNTDELGLISSVSFPLYRFLSASSANFPLGTDTALYAGKYATLVAEDILLRSLVTMVSTVKQTASMLPGLKSEGERVQEYIRDLHAVLVSLSRMREINANRAEDLHAIQERIRAYEQVLMTELGERFGTALGWAK